MPADGFILADENLAPRFARDRAPPERPLVIGLVNNMPDAAVAATEAQFRALIEQSAGGRAVTLTLFALPGVPRSEAAWTAMSARYRPAAALATTPVDALIVTGAEPVAADLKDEPFWPHLTSLIDWAERNTVSTVFSCLSAHAAVLHLDGVERRPLAEKCSGVFDLQMTDHALTRGQAEPLVAPHSRWNGLDEAALAARGYTVLTRSAEVGVDAFVRDRNSLFLFLQGHPEYQADTLMLEYRRDLRRFLIGERPTHPPVPKAYFPPAVEQALTALAADTTRRPTLSDYAKILNAARPAARWAPATERLYANWLALVAARVRA